MKRVFQTIIDKGDGDCFRAAVASILDLTIEQVPHFIRYGSDWHDIFLKFMEWHGWSYDGNNSIGGVFDEKSGSINGYFLATVPSSLYENVSHSVLMDINGVIAHDPNPNKFYLGKTNEEANVKYWSMFEKMNESNI